MTEKLIERASLLLQQKRHKEAKQNIMEVLAIEPDNINCLMMLSEINFQEGNLDQALEIINQAIGILPDYDNLFYRKAVILLSQEKIKEAEKTIYEAVSLNAYDADNMALLGHILLQKKDFEKALSAANEALEIDGSNVFALNVRSTALLKLNRKDDSYQTIEGALNEDPNNSFTHANYGWNLLEKGEKDKALEHFKESLKNNPNSEYAQSGMSEALKSKYLIYRWFLNYSFWMQNMTSKNQWIFIVGFYFAQRILNAIAKSNSALEPFITPIVVIMAVFAFSTWIITPLSNLLFRFNKYGQHLLSIEEKKSSTLVGLSLLLFFIGVISLLFINKEISFGLMLIGFTMMLPLGRFFEKPSVFFKSYNIGLFILAILSISITITTLNLFNGFTTFYFFGFIGFQWSANYFLTR